MQKFFRSTVMALCFAAVIAITPMALAAGPAAPPKHPFSMEAFKSISSSGSLKHLSVSRLSASTQAAAQGAANAQQTTIRSVPTFNGSFTFQGQAFPYTMLGHRPQAGGTTSIPTSYLAISYFFDEYVDQNGNNIVIDATANTDTILNGPEFERFGYTSGFTQFADAVQRAEFFNVMRKSRDGDHDGDDAWHTLLERPHQFKPVTVEVPAGSSVLFQAPDGQLMALIDINFLNSQLNTLVQTEDIHVDELPIFVTRNSVYGDFAGFDTPADCCVGGFHTAFEAKQVGNTVFVQTFAFATSLDNAVANDFFGDPGLFGDVNALSHEISETFNDPFVNNVVPAWQSPGLPPGSCQNVLETGDPVENLPVDYFPVTIDGFLYHPQTEALLQWFSRETPSSAFGGDYSYPGNNLTSPSQACPVSQ